MRHRGGGLYGLWPVCEFRRGNTRGGPPDVYVCVYATRQTTTIGRDEGAARVLLGVNETKRNGRRGSVMRPQRDERSDSN